ncbi:uncharacterized protein LTR77_006293 [Saxophila tyrrhenica]|uniref:Uncharacterized protein n=1 Tax=Saxophila tyrrhenica TaxID=1690608 RepID=A0AAV9PAY2_9PEZI|nr:hypothetical protein LTR77_006293 [Saxophila tyrrhenica]
MDGFLQADTENVRISKSPRRSPQITESLTSPIRSVQALQMESLHSQADVGMRTTDFFEDSSEPSLHSEDHGVVAPDANLIDRNETAEKRRQTFPSSEPFAPQSESRPGRAGQDRQGYQRLAAQEAPPRPRRMNTASSSFNGSVDELLPQEHPSSPPELRRSRNVTGYTPRSSALLDRQELHHSLMPTPKVDPTLGAYAIAHEITLNALMRDEAALDRSLQSFAPLSAEGRQSILTTAFDPRSPRRPDFSSPATAKKSVHVVPPPIDTTVPKRSIPADIVRTPYPFSPDHPKRKDFGQNSPASAGVGCASSTESTLTVSIRRRNANSKARVTSLTIPATNDFTAVRSHSVGAKERHFKALDFDDSQFFLELRRYYKELSGPLRFLSARSLRRIAVSGAATKAADVGEEQILRHYRKPALGQSRYAFVHWAHRLASATSSRFERSEGGTPEGESKETPISSEHPEGLEFVVSWSVLRILVAMLLVFALSTAAALLWIFLGRSTSADWPPRGGFRDAGDRVGAGVLVGICVLLFGASSIAGWLGLSWLVI